MSERRKPASGKRVRMPLSDEKRKSIKYSGREPREDENRPKLTPRPTPRPDRGSSDEYPRPRRSSGRDERRSDDSPRPRRTFGRDERRSDESPRPRRTEGRGERRSDGSPRPRRSFGRDEHKSDDSPRPRRSFGRDEHKSDDSPRPRRSFGRDEHRSDDSPRPRRSFGRDERRSDDSPRPRRTFGRDEHKSDDSPRPRRTEGRGERKSDEYPRPRRSSDRDERKSDEFPRPRRTEGRGERKSDEYPRPRRSSDHDERKGDESPRPRRSSRDEHKGDGFSSPKRNENRTHDYIQPETNDEGGSKEEYTITRRGEKPAEGEEVTPRPYRIEGKRESRSEGYSRAKRSEGTGERRERADGGKRDFREKREGSRTTARGRGEGEFTISKRSDSASRPSKARSVSETGEELIRLNKYISNAGICSRREADVLIASGVIMVNGKPVTEMGFKVSRTDKVQYGDQTLNTEKLRYVILNKPKGFITTADDPENRKTVMALVENACKERIYPVGRLDRNTTGLLLFTNDGEIAKKLSHPKYGIRKIYHVVVDKNVTKTDMKKIGEGMDLEDGPIQVDAIEYIEDAKDKKEIGIELHSGQNRVVRRIFESLGYKVEKLDRVAYAGLTKKNLPRGEWRYLSQMEINMLKMIH